MAKREAAIKKNKQKENDKVSKEGENVNESNYVRKTRGAKRQPGLLSPSEGTETTARKRLRKNNLSEANILNVIDEEELQRRAAHVCYIIT